MVFPQKGDKSIPSLWHELFPRSEMVWEWNEDSDDRISDLWHMMKILSSCEDVVYAKWFRGRATFFSRDVFTALLALMVQTPGVIEHPPHVARTLLDALEENSPQSTKELKAVTDLQGRDNASAYDRGLKWLFARLQIVGYGEADDGAFPSLVVGATRLIYGDLWSDASEMNLSKAQSLVDRALPKGQPFRKFLDRTLASKTDADETRPLWP